jgi:large subunit ribosomal protein L6
MSRIGKQPIAIPQGVKVEAAGTKVNVTGPLGSLSVTVADECSVGVEGSAIKVAKKAQGKRADSIWGLTRTLVANMVAGVTAGFEKKLEISGVGYKAETKGDSVVLSLGQSHPVIYELPKGIKATVDKMTSITVKGADKHLVGEVAAQLRAIRPVEPYKGKGIRYADEIVRKKAGKAAKAGAAAGGKA